MNIIVVSTGRIVVFVATLLLQFSEVMMKDV